MAWYGIVWYGMVCYAMLCYGMLWYAMECMVCYEISMLCYEISMLCYAMVYVVKVKHSANWLLRNNICIATMHNIFRTQFFVLTIIAEKISITHMLIVPFFLKEVTENLGMV